MALLPNDLIRLYWPELAGSIVEDVPEPLPAFCWDVTNEVMFAPAR